MPLTRSLAPAALRAGRVAAAAALCWLALAAGAPWAGLAPAHAARMPPGVAWVDAAADDDIDRAFTQARAEHKPVLLYWGASWCPPCNQLRATLFNRQDFIAQARHVVAVHVDGDGPGAQKLAARFKVRGYPTLVLMAADGSELTRLPGEAEPPQVMRVLQQGLAGGRPVAAVLADARAGRPLRGGEWPLLAWYGWDTDEARLVPAAERALLLAQLARACPPREPEPATRLLLKAIAYSDAGQGVKPDAALRQRVQRLLADPRASRAQMDVLVNQAPELARALVPEPGAERERLVAALGLALRRLQADASLSRADRLSALGARVELARLDQPRQSPAPQLPAALRDEVKALAARLDREVSDSFERQAVVTAAAYTLGRAGLWADSDALLQANLARSHSAYYLMSQLGGNARQQGRPDEALAWYEQAYQKSVGPATRLQWGAGYVAALVDLSPQDSARIERAVGQLIQDAAQDPAAFHERSARALKRVSDKLASWNQGGRHQAQVQRLRAALAPVCARLPEADAQRGTCDGLFKG